MKTSPARPGRLGHKAKTAAVVSGQLLHDFVVVVLRQKPSPHFRNTRAPDWMQGFGKLKRLRRETARVQSIVDKEFERIEPEDRR